MENTKMSIEAFNKACEEGTYKVIQPDEIKELSNGQYALIYKELDEVRIVTPKAKN